MLFSPGSPHEFDARELPRAGRRRPERAGAAASRHSRSVRCGRRHLARYPLARGRASGPPPWQRRRWTRSRRRARSLRPRAGRRGVVRSDRESPAARRGSKTSQRHFRMVQTAATVPAVSDADDANPMTLKRAHADEDLGARRALRPSAAKDRLPRRTRRGIHRSTRQTQPALAPHMRGSLAHVGPATTEADQT